MRNRRARPVRRGGSQTRPYSVAIVASLGEARASLASASRAGTGCVLVSPPGAAATLGVGYFRALVDAVAAEFPGVPLEAAMDCGADPGYALAALRLGFKRVILAGHPKARARVADIARQMGASVASRPPRARGPKEN